MNIGEINIPKSPFLDISTNRPSREWLLYLLGLGRSIQYGSFFDTTNQSTTANTPKAMTFNTTDLINGVYLDAVTSRIKFSQGGLYNFQFSAQVENTDASLDDVTVWLRKNGTNVADTAGTVSIPAKHAGTNGHAIMAWNYFVSVLYTDYIELIWMPGLTTTTLPTIAATATVPRIPSIILTVNQVNF